MATVQPNLDATITRRTEGPVEPEPAAGAAPRTQTGSLLVILPSLAPDALAATLHNIATALPGADLLALTPDGVPHESFGVNTVTYTPQVASRSIWVPTAADMLNAYSLVNEHQARGCLMLGTETQSLSAEAIAKLATPLMNGADLVTACYDMGPHEGLVNSALLYPVTRGLYGTSSRFPLSLDLCVSRRMAERLATTAQKATATGQNEAILWPTAEAAVAGFSIEEAAVGTRILPAPAGMDLTALLTQVGGSLFADIEAKAASWQRSRSTVPSNRIPATEPTNEAIDVQPMLDSFRHAYANLHEIWSLVLPPNSLLGLKKLSLMTPENFRMPDALWARTVYDFVLAYRLRTINRGHLLGALTPLYLAWVASHLLLTRDGSAEAHVEQVAQAFTSDKAYLVSRWRWPDRFNP